MGQQQGYAQPVRHGVEAAKRHRHAMDVAGARCAKGHGPHGRSAEHVERGGLIARIVDIGADVGRDQPHRMAVDRVGERVGEPRDIGFQRMGKGIDAGIDADLARRGADRQRIEDRMGGRRVQRMADGHLQVARGVGDDGRA
jgi:hypothetical protein